MIHTGSFGGNGVMNQLVSILIPLFNAEKWLGETVESALSQTWPKKEIIIVDDGSTDNSLQLAKQYESEIVKVVYQENRGAAAARNKAMGYAQGEHVQWLDADDLLAPDKIERQMRAIQNEGDWKTLLTASWAKFYYRYHKAKFTPDNLWQDLKPVEWLLIKFNENVYMNPAVWLVSRKLTELAGPWDERLSLDDDGEYFARLVSASENVRFVPDARCYYRKSNPLSLSRDLSPKACESLFLSLSLCISYLRAIENSVTTRTSCLRLLQRNMRRLCSGPANVVKRANDLASELGGILTPPDFGWKYSLAQKILGPKLAKIAKKKMLMLRESLAWNWDKLQYNLSKK